MRVSAKRREDNDRGEQRAIGVRVRRGYSRTHSKIQFCRVNFFLRKYILRSCCVFHAALFFLSTAIARTFIGHTRCVRVPEKKRREICGPIICEIY